MLSKHRLFQLLVLGCASLFTTKLHAQQVPDSTLNYGWKWKKATVADRLFRTDLIAFSEGKTNFAINPELEQIVLGDWWRNGRGVSIKAYNQKFSFYTALLEVQDVNPPAFLNQFARETNAIPGHSRWKSFKVTGFDYTRVRSEATFKLAKNWKIRGGFSNMGTLPYEDLNSSYSQLNYPFIASELGFRGTSWLAKRLVLLNNYARLQELKRLPSTASAEASFFSKSLNQAGIRLTLGAGFSVYLFENHLRYRNSLATGKATSAKLADFIPVPGLLYLSSDKSQYSTDIQQFRLLFADSGKVIAFNSGIELLTDAFNSFGLATSLQASFNFSGDAWRKTRGTVLDLGFSYAKLTQEIANAFSQVGHLPGALNSLNRRLEVNVNLRVNRLFAGARINYFSGAKLEGFFTPAMASQLGGDFSIQDYSLGYTVNPTNDFRLKVGYLSHSKHKDLSNLYLGISTNFGRNKFDY